MFFSYLSQVNAQDTTFQLIQMAIINFITMMVLYPAKEACVDGKPDGYWKNYHPNGLIKSEGNRKNIYSTASGSFMTKKEKLYWKSIMPAKKKMVSDIPTRAMRPSKNFS